MQLKDFRIMRQDNKPLVTDKNIDLLNKEKTIGHRLKNDGRFIIRTVISEPMYLYSSYRQDYRVEKLCFYPPDPFPPILLLFMLYATFVKNINII